MHLPDYFSVGYEDTGRVGPDGSLELEVNIPSEEEGENLKGEYLEESSTGKRTIRLEIPLQ